MREKIIALLLTAFLVTGIKAIPKDSVIYSYKAGVISPYCFKYNKRYSDGSSVTHSYPFNSGFTLGLDASGKNFSLEFSLDHTSFRRIDYERVNDSIVETRDMPFSLTQFRFLPKYRIMHSANSSLNIGGGLTIAFPSQTYDRNDPKQGYFLSLGNGICYNIYYTYELPKRRLGLNVGVFYEKLNSDRSIGRSRGKYDYGESQEAPILMISLGIRYSLGPKQIH
jgi:hypothetical protein